MGINDSTVSKQWSNRPDDQRFLTVDDLYAAVSTRRQESKVHDVALDVMQVRATDAGEMALYDGTGTQGGLLSNWSFGQLCARAKAPAGYLRTLPAELAAIPLQWSMEMHESAGEEGNDAKILVRRNGDTRVTAVTSPTYGRIWDSEVVQAIRNGVDLTRWKVPAASYSATDPKRATTLYASDRDVFVFLVCEDAVEAGGEVLRRGFYVENSEVGAATLSISTFTYDYVCDNRIIWGQKNFRQLKIRHTSGAPSRFVNTAVPQLNSYAQSSANEIRDTVTAAKARVVGKDKKSVVEWMRARGFTAGLAGRAFDAAENDPRRYDPTTVWGIVQGVTDVAHEITHTNDRVDVETRAGELLENL